MVDIISFSAELIGAIAAFFTAIIIIKRDPKYRGNQLFTLSFSLFFLYALSVMIYELEFSLQLSFISFQISLMLIAFALSFFVTSMQVFIKSTTFLKERAFIILLLGSSVTSILFVIFPYNIDGLPVVDNTSANLLSLIPLGIWQYGMLIYNLVMIRKALKNISPEKEQIKSKIKFLGYANAVGILCPTMAILSNILNIRILSSLVYIFLAVSMGIVSFTVRKKTN
ncbi:MAG: hypothetical protein GY870_00665 [archaeon]|nr:hypothetical protein [archaeon]